LKSLVAVIKNRTNAARAEAVERKRLVFIVVGLEGYRRG
jgi:hypothetical protein